MFVISFTLLHAPHGKLWYIYIVSAKKSCRTVAMRKSDSEQYKNSKFTYYASIVPFRLPFCVLVTALWGGGSFWVCIYVSRLLLCFDEVFARVLVCPRACTSVLPVLSLNNCQDTTSEDFRDADCIQHHRFNTTRYYRKYGNF